jgi:hypothetical protein
MAGRFLFATWAGGGNVPPVLALGERLQARGHRVRAIGTDSLAARLSEPPNQRTLFTLCVCPPWIRSNRSRIAIDPGSQILAVLSRLAVAMRDDPVWNAMR